MSRHVVVIGAVATPRWLNVPGESLDGVFHVSNLHDAERIREAVAKGRVKKAVVVGAGFIGLALALPCPPPWSGATTP